VNGGFLFFTHILKAGGTSVETALRRALGIRHMAVDPPVGWIYTPEDFRFDRRLNPMAVSFSSHWLRPFTSFGDADARIRWHTMLRDPVSRYRSHRQHHLERFRITQSAEEWLAEPIFRNWQTRQIAGEEDLAAARQILEQKFAFVGLLEQFAQSVHAMGVCLGVPNLEVPRSGPQNRARSEATRRRIEDEFARHEDVVLHNNELDLRLYSFVRDELYPRQVVGADGAGQLGTSARSERFGDARLAVNLAFRRLVQLPLYRLRAAQAARNGRADVRR
jgi:hypothetical protein